MLDLARLAGKAFYEEDFDQIVALLSMNWELKKQITPLISSNYIDGLCEKAKICGATAWKLLGCGKDGFLFCFVDDLEKFKLNMNMSYLDVDFDRRGSRII